MSTATTDVHTTSRGDLGRVVLAEWTKFRTVRSSFWTLVISVALTVGVGAAFLPVVVDTYHGPAGQAASWAIEEGWWFEGLHVGILAVMILGVLVASSEYGTGTIRATLTAVPSRARALTAKTVSFAAVTLVAGAVQAYAVFAVTQPILADRSIDISLTDPAALRGVAMATLAIAGTGLFGLGFGLLIRHTAGAIGAVVAVMLVIPGLAQLLPPSWDTVVKAYPAYAMNGMFTPGEHTLSPGPATAVYLGYVALLLAIAGLAFARRDA